jgi:hypothetical protein
VTRHEFLAEQAELSLSNSSGRPAARAYTAVRAAPGDHQGGVTDTDSGRDTARNLRPLLLLLLSLISLGMTPIVRISVYFRAVALLSLGFLLCGSALAQTP